VGCNCPFECNSEHFNPCRWFNQWARYTGFTDRGSSQGSQELIRANHTSAERPGPIDNNSLLGRDNDPESLKPDLREGQNFKLLSEPAWDYLQGLYSGGPAIPRRVVRNRDNSRAYVEVYPRRVYVVKSSQLDTEIPISISSQVMPDPTALCTALMATDDESALGSNCVGMLKDDPRHLLNDCTFYKKICCRDFCPRSRASDDIQELDCVAQDSVIDLKEKACKACNVEEVDVQMWDYYNKSFVEDEPMDKKPDFTMDAYKIIEGQHIMLLEKVGIHSSVLHLILEEHQ
jgi:hypothetical protein